MSFDQDPGEQANISAADLAIMVDEMKELQRQLAETEHRYYSLLESSSSDIAQDILARNEMLYKKLAEREVEVKRLDKGWEEANGKLLDARMETVAQLAEREALIDVLRVAVSHALPWIRYTAADCTKLDDALAIPTDHTALDEVIVNEIVQWYYADNATEEDKAAVRKYVSGIRKTT